MLVRPLASGIAVSPPLTADESHLRLLADAIAEGVAALEAAARLHRSVDGEVDSGPREQGKAAREFFTQSKTVYVGKSE